MWCACQALPSCPLVARLPWASACYGLGWARSWRMSFSSILAGTVAHMVGALQSCWVRGDAVSCMRCCGQVGPVSMLAAQASLLARLTCWLMGAQRKCLGSPLFCHRCARAGSMREALAGFLARCRAVRSILYA